MTIISCSGYLEYLIDLEDDIIVNVIYNRIPSFISSLVHIEQKTFKALILFLSLIRLLRIVINTVMPAYLKGMFGPEARPTVASRLPKTSSCSYMWFYRITIK